MSFDDLLSTGLSMVPPYAAATTLMATISNGPLEAALFRSVFFGLLMFAWARLRLAYRRHGTVVRPMHPFTAWRLRNPGVHALAYLVLAAAASIALAMTWTRLAAEVLIIVLTFSFHAPLATHRHARHHPELVRR